MDASLLSDVLTPASMAHLCRRGDVHRFKRRVKPILSFKSLASVASTFASIELVSMIRKGQFRPGCVHFSNSVSLRPEGEQVIHHLCDAVRFATALVLPA